MNTLQDKRRADERLAIIATVLKTMNRHNITIEDLQNHKPVESADKETYQRVRTTHKPTKPPKPLVEPVRVLDLKKPFSVRNLS